MNGTKYQLIEPIVDPDRMILNITATKLLKGSERVDLLKILIAKRYD